MSSASKTLIEWLREAPFTLTLGSGFFGFFAHCGVLRALLDHDLQPARLTGASSGALIAGCYASGLSIEQIEAILFTMKREAFWDPGWGWGWLKGEKFRRQLRQTLATDQFEQCRLPLSLSVYNQSTRRTEVWQNGDLVDAIYASCALPFLFQPLTRHGIRFCDGGVADRPALHGTSDDERVLIHHLASKSPWRRRHDPALQPPQKNNSTTIVLDQLTRTSPFKLHTGRDAYEQARHTTTNLLHTAWQRVLRKSVI